MDACVKGFGLALNVIHALPAAHMLSTRAELIPQEANVVALVKLDSIRWEQVPWSVPFK